MYRITAVFAGLIAGISLAASATRAAEHRVSSAADVATAAAAARPGDVLVMADGVWRDQAIILKAAGTAQHPIELRAQTPSKVVLTGQSSVTAEGEHLVVSGLLFRGGEGAKAGILLKGSHCRLTESAILDSAFKLYVRLWGAGCRVDRCYFAGKTSEGPTLQVEVEQKPNGHLIERNTFGPRPPLGRNGGETIRIGYSHQSMLDSGTLVQRNLFDACDGELEIISNKSCGNIYRGNMFLRCAGMLTLRHGNRCTVEGNIFLGHGKKGTGGIRVIGEDHLIINNHIEQVERGGIWLTSGVPDSPLNGYYRARNCLVAFNTIADSAGPCIELDNGFGSSGRTLRPQNITLANNVLHPGKGGTVFQGQEGEAFQWVGNIASAGVGVGARPGMRIADPKLSRSADGLLRPAADSPVRGAAEGEFPAVKLDIDGQPRTGKLDAGCDQSASGPIESQPVTAAEARPTWMDR